MNKETKISYKSIKKISGWLGFVDYEIFKTLNTSNTQTPQAALEIGVHHGKSTLAIACFSNNRKIYIIDIFEDQDKNIDQSGNGNKEIFLKNMSKFGVASERLIIDQRMSNRVTPIDVTNSVGLISFFHIDGGHHKDAVESDIKLAYEVASDDCVIAIDDMFRSEWPEVSSTVFASEDLKNKGFSLFAIGFNKGYWCKNNKYDEKQKLLLENQYLSPFLHKVYKVEGRRVLIFQRYPLPEWGTGKLLLWYLEIYHPSIYRPMGIINKKLRKTAKKLLQKNLS